MSRSIFSIGSPGIPHQRAWVLMTCACEKQPGIGREMDVILQKNARWGFSDALPRIIWEPAWLWVFEHATDRSCGKYNYGCKTWNHVCDSDADRFPKIFCVKWVILRLQERIDQTPFCAETPPLLENLRMPFPNSDVSMKWMHRVICGAAMRCDGLQDRSQKTWLTRHDMIGSSYSMAGCYHTMFVSRHVSRVKVFRCVQCKGSSWLSFQYWLVDK